MLFRSVFSYQIFGFLVVVVREQMIEQFFVNGHIISLLRVGFSTTPVWPFTQTILHPRADRHRVPRKQAQLHWVVSGQVPWSGAKRRDKVLDEVSTAVLGDAVAENMKITG